MPLILLNILFRKGDIFAAFNVFFNARHFDGFDGSVPVGSGSLFGVQGVPDLTLDVRSVGVDAANFEFDLKKKF